MYSLKNKFISETLAMCFAIFLGTSVVANELLPNTKGHGMGYFGTVMGFSFAFVISGTFFGTISAELNPAMFFYLAIRGKISWKEFVVGSVADFLGAFIGAILTYLFWASHFWTVPLPQDPDPVSRLINGPPDALSNDAARFASAFGTESTKDQDKSLMKELVSFGDKIVNGTPAILDEVHSTESEDSHDQIGLYIDDEEKVRNEAEDGPQTTRTSSDKRLRSTSVDIILEKMEVERIHRATASSAFDGNFYSALFPPVIDTLNSSTTHDSVNSLDSNGFGSSNSDHEKKTNDPKSMKSSKNLRFKLPKVNEVTKKMRNSITKTMRLKQKKEAEEIRDAAFEAAIRADQSAKLSIFATRPARYNRVANLFQEMTAAFFLIFGIQMINLRLRYNTLEAEITSPYIKSILIAFYVVALSLGLGGTTGLAVNPARDLGPRLAHFVLPIAGKGSSEWNYAFIPLIAPMLGAAIAAGIMEWMEVMFDSEEPDL
jgi:glycerol uptake facilitator-like aquaporin